jgi:hypothetical protein
MINVTIWLKDDSVEIDQYPQASDTGIGAHGTLYVYRNGRDDPKVIATYADGTWLRAWTDGQEASDASYVPAGDPGDGDPTP